MRALGERRAARRKTPSDPDDLGLGEFLAESDGRTWWDYNRGRAVALGLDNSMNTVKNALEKQRFDVRADDYLHGSFVHRVTNLICGS
jgi:hypothetical protein